MKRFSEQLHKQSQTVKLSKSEQVDLRERIVSYMEYHPLPAEMKAAPQNLHNKKPTGQTLLNEAFTQFAIPYRMLFKFGSVAAVFVLIVIPFMAERTVPGDTLYAVKVQFNEEVRSTLTWGSYEKVEWETTRLNRRIAEARLLADEGLLTPEAEAEVAAAVKVHSDNAKREIAELRESDADEATIAEMTLASSLEVQAQIFKDSEVSELEEGSVHTGDLISDAIDESREKPAQIESADVPAYDKLMARVELNTTRVHELKSSLEGSVSDQALADVTRRLEDIDRVVGEAIELAANDASELEAREMLVAVLTRTQKLIIFMTDLEVQERVTIEAVVPVVPTQDEITVERTSRLNTLDNMLAKLTVAKSSSTNDLQEKLADTVTKLTATKATLHDITSYQEFIALSTTALTLGTDALQLLESQGVNTTKPTLPQEVEVPGSKATTTEADALVIPRAPGTVPIEVPATPKSE